MKLNFGIIYSIILDIQDKYGIHPQIISGELEAELIYHGVKLALPFKPEKTFLIMDIGGGSVEFIISDKKKGAFCNFFVFIFHIF